MIMNARFSVVVPTNARPYCLERLLESLKFFDSQPDCIIVGNSTPESAAGWIRDWYDSLLDSHGVMNIRLAPNESPSASRRELISYSRSEYVLLLDDDVIVTPSSYRIIDTIGCSDFDLLGGVWLQPQGSNYSQIISEGEARKLPRSNLWQSTLDIATIGYVYSFSHVNSRAKVVVKTPVRCVAMLRTQMMVDDLVPSLIARREVFDSINFDSQYLHFFEWFDFFMQARNAGLRYAVDTGAQFVHIPEAYANPASPQLNPRELDRMRFSRKWGMTPLFSGEASTDCCLAMESLGQQ